MSLDGPIMRRNYGERGRGQVRGRVRGWGQGQGPSSTFVGRGVRMLRQGPLRINRSSPFRIAKSFSRTKGLLWRHDLFEDSMAAAGLAGAEGVTKLYISNLDHGVSNNDIKELFSEVGDLKRCTTHYDRNGRSSGSAEVVYTRRSDAIAAVKRYNNVQLDGKPMKIEIIGNNLGLPITPRVNVVGGANGRGKRTVVMTPEFGQGGRTFKQLSGFECIHRACSLVRSLARSFVRSFVRSLARSDYALLPYLPHLRAFSPLQLPYLFHTWYQRTDRSVATATSPQVPLSRNCHSASKQAGQQLSLGIFLAEFLSTTIPTVFSLAHLPNYFFPSLNFCQHQQLLFLLVFFLKHDLF